MNATNKNITLLFESERSALYEVPEFTTEQRTQYFTLTEKELALALGRKDLSAQIYFILQLGYFKAVKAFYRIQWIDVDSEDCQFILEQYFPNQSWECCTITKYEFYTQSRIISQLFEYRLWKNAYRSLLSRQVEKFLSRDITAQYIMMELLTYLEDQKIIRPGYTTLQSIISSISNVERKRLADIILSSLNSEDKALLDTLIIDGNTLSNLAAIKQDAKDFKRYMIRAERQKLERLHPIYQLAKRITPALKLSTHNMHHYASLVSYYTIYDLRKRLKLEQSYLYLLCYVLKRYQEISDNLIAAFCYHFKQIEEKVKTLAKNNFSNHVVSQNEELMHMRQLAKLYIDDTLPDNVSFGFVRQKAFSILSRKTLIGTLAIAEKKQLQEVDFYWQAVDEIKHSVKTNLRHIVDSLTFSSTTQANSFLNAIHSISSLRNRKGMKAILSEAHKNIIPLKLRLHILMKDENPSQINTYRYEYWVYRKLHESIKTGAIYLEDSLRYKSLNHELVSLEEKEDLIQDLDIPVLKQPIKQQLDALFAELQNLWKKFDSSLRRGKLKHLKFDEKAKTLHIKKSRVCQDEKIEHRFYEQVPFCDIVDVLRFVDKHTHFTSAFTHIQPRYAKQPLKEYALIATIIAQAMNNGNLNMSEIANIPYASLQDTLQSRIRLSTLKTANDFQSWYFYNVYLSSLFL